jgi:thiamine monophosphate kinase
MMMHGACCGAPHTAVTQHVNGPTGRVEAKVGHGVYIRGELGQLATALWAYVLWAGRAQGAAVCVDRVSHRTAAPKRALGPRPPAPHGMKQQMGVEIAF